MNHSELAKEIVKLKNKIAVLEFYRENPSGYKMRIKEYPNIYCFRKSVFIDFVYNDKISSVELPIIVFIISDIMRGALLKMIG